MNEAEFDESTNLRPFGPDDVAQADFKARRYTALGVALFGQSSADLERQLLAPHPEIPVGCTLDDLWHLLRTCQAMASPRSAVWETRCEVVRRAIKHLDGG